MKNLTNCSPIVDSIFDIYTFGRAVQAKEKLKSAVQSPVLPELSQTAEY